MLGAQRRLRSRDSRITGLLSQRTTASSRSCAGRELSDLDPEALAAATVVLERLAQFFDKF